MTAPIFAQALFDFSLVLPALVVLIVVSILLYVVRQYKRCPSNRVLVVYGKVGGEQAARCVHGGGVFIVPLFQDYQFLSLEPLAIEIALTGALSKKNIRVNVPSTFTIGVSTDPAIMNNAAERLLGLGEPAIAVQARDIILGQMRLVIATLSIEEINQDREKFLDLVNKYCSTELLKIGLEVINVNIRDITDESGYIDAIGKKAAAEAIETAKVGVAEQQKDGAIGEARANRERAVEVANQESASLIGRKQAEREQRIRTAKLEAEGVSGEAEASREQDVVTAQQAALTEEATKLALMTQRVRVATLEAEAVEGENTSQASIAASNATLLERQADARRRGDVARADAARDVLIAEKGQELARLQKEDIVRQEIDRQRIEIEASAEAEKRRLIARGDADAVLAGYEAEAKGVQGVLEAKARGYEQLLKVCALRPDLAPTLLVIEKLPELVAEQVKAIQNLKIDKITVWDSGAGSDGSNGATANFLSGLIGSLPPIHELAQQAGIDLPEVLGSLKPKAADGAATDGDEPAAPQGLDSLRG